jgi:hypothetical protein
MGTWTLIARAVNTSSGNGSLYGPTGTLYQGGITGMHLLTDGRVMLENGSSHQLLTPDSSGSYKTGSFSQTTVWPERTSFDQRWGPSGVVLDDGKVFFLGGHPGSIAAGSDEDSYLVWDPFTNVFNLVADARCGHQGRSGMSILDDGKVFYDRSSVPYYYDKTLGINPISGMTSVGGTDLAWETVLTKCPDGRLLGFATDGTPASGATRSVGKIFVIDPSYSNSLVASGSRNGTNTRNLYNVTNYVNRATYDWAHKIGAVASDPVWVNLDGYEISGSMWYYKINKVAIMGAHGGEIYTAHPDTPTTVNMVGKAPWSSTYFGANSGSGFGAVSAIHAGQTTAQIVAGNSLSIVLNSPTINTQLLGTFCLFTANGRFCRIQAGSNNAAVGVNAVGSTITYTGLSLSWGDSTSVVNTGSQARYEPPLIRAAECWAAILPSGKMLFASGIAVNGDYCGTFRGWLWDGVATTPTDLTPNTDTYVTPTLTVGSALFPPTMDASLVCGGAGWLTGGINLPTGELLFFNPYGLFIYSEGVAADSTQAPIIDSIPSTMGQGQAYRITGRQLHGLHIGSTQQDDAGLINNHPLVQFTQGGVVTYIPSYNWSNRSIQPNRSSTLDIKIPARMATGTYTVKIITNGVASSPVTVTVTPTDVGQGESLFFRYYGT